MALFPSKRQSKIIALIAALTMLVVGCGGAISHGSIRPVPPYRYPNKNGGKNVKLISILTDPYGDSFAQGTLNAMGGQGQRSFVRPFTAVVGSDSSIYILDNGKGMIYHMDYTANGALTKVTLLPKQKRSFPSATNLAITPLDEIWLVDSRLKAVFRLSPDGEVIDSITDIFLRPVGIAYHPSLEQMLVTDLAANSISFFDLDGRLIATHSSAPGLLIETPSFLAIGPEGDIYLVEALSGLIKVFTPELEIKNIFGGFGDGPGYFAKPKGIAVDSKKRIYVADALFDNVQIFSGSGELLLTLGTTGTGIAEFWQPMGITVDERQNIYIADSFNQRVQVFCWEDEGE